MIDDTYRGSLAQLVSDIVSDCDFAVVMSLSVGRPHVVSADRPTNTRTPSKSQQLQILSVEVSASAATWYSLRNGAYSDMLEEAQAVELVLELCTKHCSKVRFQVFNLGFFEFQMGLIGWAPEDRSLDMDCSGLVLLCLSSQPCRG